MMKIKTIFVAGAACLLSAGAADASITTYEGWDDGAAVTGPFTNSAAAAASFGTAAGGYGTVKTETFEGAATGFSSPLVLDGVTVTLAAPNYGSSYSGVSSTTYGNVYGFDIGTGSGR